jgi:N-carbamoylputrescine amidase
MSAGEKTEDNLAKAMERIAAAAKKGAQIVCLQELFRSRYFCQSENQRNFRLAESIPGPTTEALSALAEARQIVIVASVFERRSAGVYHNTAVILDADGSIAGITTRKMHIPDDPLSTTENILLHPRAISDFASFQTALRKSQRACVLGPSGSPKARGRRHYQGANSHLPHCDRLDSQ